MRIRVESYDGYRVHERPVRFHLGTKTREIVEVLDRWFGEDHDYFKVRADDGAMYVLRYGRYDDHWELTHFSSASAGKNSMTAGKGIRPRGPVH